MNHYEVIVELKPEVLDTEGRAISESLRRAGQENLKNLKVTKRFVLELDQSCQNPEQYAREIAQEYLANPVSENFHIKKVEN